jgi:hypothetical protein
MKAYCLKSPEGEKLCIYFDKEHCISFAIRVYAYSWMCLEDQGYRIVEVDVIEPKGDV